MPALASVGCVPPRRRFRRRRGKSLASSPLVPLPFGPCRGWTPLRRETDGSVASDCRTPGAPASPPAAAAGGQESRPAVRPAPFDAARRRPHKVAGLRPAARLPGASPQEGLRVRAPTRARRRLWLLPPRLDGPKGRGASGRSRSLGEGDAGARFGRLRSAAASVSATAREVTCLKPAGPPSLRSLPRLGAVAPRDGRQRSIRLSPTGCAGVPAGCRRRRPGNRAAKRRPTCGSQAG